MNPPGDPRSHHRWSVWRQMNSLGFAENISKWNWIYDSTDSLISCVRLHSCLGKTRTSIGSFWPFLIDFMVWADYWSTDHPELRRATQPSTTGGPLDEPGFCIFRSTVRDARAVMYVGIANLRWQGKRSRHSRRMRNPQFYVSGKRPMSQCSQSSCCHMASPDHNKLVLDKRKLHWRKLK